MSPQEMAEHMGGEPNGIAMKPGETKDLIWKFGHESQVQYACHIPGYYAAGMIGDIQVKQAD